MDNKSYFFVFWHMQPYMSWYIRSFFGFTFLNILYFFKYFCTNIFHRRSLCTFYYIIFCHLLHTFWGKPGVCFHFYFAIYDECKYSDTFWLADRTCLFVQYTISLSSLCKLIWRHWTCKMPVRYILSSVWVRLSIFSPLSILQYVGLYVFSLPISLVMIERIYILCLIIIKSEVWTITHCLGLGHETMVSAVCLSIFLHTVYTMAADDMVMRVARASVCWNSIYLLVVILVYSAFTTKEVKILALMSSKISSRWINN